MKLQERIKNCFVKCKTSTLKTLERIKTGFNKMKSRNKIIVVVTIILLLLSIVTLSVVFSVRGNNATNQTTIVFDTVDGVEIEPLLINNEYQLPAPTREGYTFIGWFANPEHIGDPITSVSPQDAESITVYAKWEIIKTDYDMSSASWNYTEPFTYDGSEKIVSVTGLPEGVTVIEYTSNTATNVGNYTASVTFNYDNANYNEPSIADLDWNIAQATNNWTEALNISGWIYNGTANSPTASATFGTASFSYSDSETGTYNSIVPTDAGTWWIKATVAETTNYTSLEDITSFDIAKADFDMTGVSWDYVSAFTYDGTAKTVELTGLPNGVEIDKYSNHIKTDAGNYTASVTFDYDTTNYNEPSVADLNWVISKADYDMSGASWVYTEAFTYDGTAKTVELTGLPNGVEIDKYSNHIKTEVGNYTASVTFTYDSVNYNTPSIADLEWTISKANYDMSGASWVYTEAFTYDGNEKTVTVTGLPSGVTVDEYTDNAKTSAGTYTASVTFTYDSDNYNTPSIADLEWEISKANYDMSGASWVYTEAFTYDGTAKTVELTGLPSGVTVDKYSNHIKTDAGNYTASVTFDYDTTNYNEPSVADLNWVISKADYDMSGVSWDYVSAFTYDGTAKTVELTGLPNGVEIDKYSNHIKTEVGNYTASVTFVYDTTNYNEPSIADLEWEISKANYDMSGASWVYTEAFTYDGNEKTVTVTGLPSGITVDEYTDNAKTSVGTYTASVTFTYDSDNYNTPSMADLEWEIKSAGTEGLQYTYISGTDSYSVSYGSATDTDIVILSSYDDGTNGLKPVTTIAESAFSCKNLTSVTIPNSVTTIGKHAFIGNYLTSVTIPNSVTTIGIEAFYDNSLTSVTIPNSVTTIESNAFAFNSLTSVTISNSVTTIGSGTFAHNSLTSVIIPDSVTTIGSCVFTCNDVYIYTQVASKPANWMEDWSLGILGVYWLGEW